MKKSQLRELIREVIRHKLREAGSLAGPAELHSVDDLKAWLENLADDDVIDHKAAALIWNHAEYGRRHGRDINTILQKARIDIDAERRRYEAKKANEPGALENVNEELTKKDFILMAQEIRKAAPQYHDVLTRFAIVLGKAQNPRFDEARFRAAVESGKGI